MTTHASCGARSLRRPRVRISLPRSVKDGGKDDFDPEQDAVRPYTPVSDLPDGKFELLVKRYDSGAASQWLYALDVGATVDFKHSARRPTTSHADAVARAAPVRGPPSTRVAVPRAAQSRST